MGESNDSFFNGILLENIDKEIPSNFGLLTTPVKDTPSISKTSTIFKLENYIVENYDEATKIQLKKAILRQQQLPNDIKEKGHLDEPLRNLHSYISPLKREIGFLREEVKEKKAMSLEHCSDATPVNSKVAVHVKVNKISEKIYDTCTSIISSPIELDNNRQLTKLAKYSERYTNNRQCYSSTSR